MKILVDADACPVKSIIVNIAKKENIRVIMVFDTSHCYNDGYSLVKTVDKGPDSVDFAIINCIDKGDICITQDYGLAVMAMSKSAFALHQNGFEYTDLNIGRMLFERHISREMRKNGFRSTKIKKRAKENDIKFEKFFSEFIARIKDV